jgi:hypothetical protein
MYRQELDHTGVKQYKLHKVQGTGSNGKTGLLQTEDN